MQIQAGSDQAVGSEVLLRGEIHQLSQTGAGAVDAALDRADVGAADLGCVLVRHALGRDEQERLPLLDAQPGQGGLQVVKSSFAPCSGRTARLPAIMPSGSCTSRRRRRSV